MAASAKIRDRIRKLIALSSSPEINEAARAREEADRLMAKHGLSMSDFQDDVVEVVDENRNELRQRLALAVSISRRCTEIVNKNKIAFRGHPTNVKSAVKLYVQLVTTVDDNCELGPQAPGRDLHRLCFWKGFVDAIVERLMDDEVFEWQETRKVEFPKPKSIEKRENEEAVVTTAIEIEKESSQFSQYFPPAFKYGVDILKRDAYAAGQVLGIRMEIESRDKIEKRIALTEGEES